MKQDKPYRRRRKLVKPRLQLRLVGAFLGVSAVGFLLQALLLTSRLTDLLAGRGDVILQDSIPSLVMSTLLVSFVFLLPVTLAVGIAATFKIAGPLYRFEQHLSQIARGEETGPCRIRRGDELHELCELINRAVERLQNNADEQREEDPSTTERSAA